MTLNLELTAELAERLRIEAASRGVTETDAIRGMLDRFLPKWVDPSLPFDPNDADSRPPLTPNEQLTALEAAEREFASWDLPLIPLEALRRENMYEDRGL